MIGEFIIKKIREKSGIQGHTLTGKFEAGLYTEESWEGVTYVIRGFDTTGVGKYIDRFLEPSRVPYSRGSGASKSKFIEGLKGYAILRFRVGNVDALRAAFAMAENMKKYGRPTPGSYRYSKNGSRTGVISNTLEENTEELKKLALEIMRGKVRIEILNLIRNKLWQSQ